MKNSVVSVAAVAVLFSLLVSCVSLQDRELTVQEKADASLIGTVTTTFTVFRGLHFIGNSEKIREKAYQGLMKEAQKNYQGDYAIRNISIKGGFSAWELVYGLGLPVLGFVGDAAADTRYPITIIGIVAGLLTGHFQKITVTGDVVLLGVTRTDRQKLEEALTNAAATLINAMPGNMTIAILSVYSDDSASAEYVIDELEFKLVDARKFKIVDRRRLEQIRREQNFQMSGDVSDDSAVSIGNMLGANIVITGDISRSGASNRLVLRALDVTTAQIIMMAREQF